MTPPFRTPSSARNRYPRRTASDWYSPRFEVLESRYLLSLTSPLMSGDQDAQDGDDPLPAIVSGRQLFYNNSIWDNEGYGYTNASAIATDKAAYIPIGSNTSTFASMSSFERGVNGIAVDVTGAHGTITTDDFTIRVSGQLEGANNAPGTWAAAPSFTVTLVPDAPTSGTDRFELVWADGAITNRYVYVLVEGNDALGGFNTNTGLATSDVFFFGNMIGDTGQDAYPYPYVNVADQLQTRANSGDTDILSVFDFNRDAEVNAADQLIVRNSLGGFMPALGMSPSPPALDAALTNDTGPDSTPNADGITTDPSVSGTLAAANGLAGFRAGLNEPPTIDAMGQLSGGTFSFDEAFLEALNGEPLDDGAYVLHLLAVDPIGLVTTTDVSFTLKTSIAPPAVPDLIAADDTGASPTDNITKIAAPRIDVTAETSSLVRLYVDGAPVQQGTGAPGLQFTLAALPDGSYDVHVVTQDGAGNSAASPTLPITISTALPTLSATTLVTVSSDLTPHVNVAASGPLGLPDGTQITIDVDLNYDGDFVGAGELNRTTSTLYDGESYFQVTPALPADSGGAAYLVQLRARVTDVAGNEGTSTPTSLKIDRIGNTHLDDYVTPTLDPTYSIIHTLDGGNFTYYVIDLTSQTWRSLDDVNKPTWKHWLQIYVPDGAITDTALLFIDGGSNTPTAPSTITTTVAQLGGLAVTLGSIFVQLPTVPNQPLVFTGEPPRSEDALIAYTFDQYTSHLGDPGNETWPALLPMVQSAVAAMDTTQDIFPSIDDFVVTGYSKRGWTTWLTAAVDDRVRGIIPGVIDILNMGEQMLHHYGAYGTFSEAIDDYTAFDFPQESFTVGGQEIGRVVDPFTYIYNGKFDDMPKLMINSTGDEFFLPDAAEFYFSDLPGTDNYLRYVPNTQHELNLVDPIVSTVSFFSDIVNEVPLPEFSWTVEQDGSIVVQTVDTPSFVFLWQATNPDARDFRKVVVDPSIEWTFETLPPQSPNTYVASVPTPASGATAFFVELYFPSSNGTYPHIFTTQIKIATNIPLVTWPFFMPTNPPPAAPLFGPTQDGDDAGGDDAGGATIGGDADAVAAALASPADDAGDSGTTWQPPLLLPAVAISAAGAGQTDQVLASGWSWADDDESDPPTDNEADELALFLLDDDWL